MEGSIKRPREEPEYFCGDLCKQKEARWSDGGVGDFEKSGGGLPDLCPVEYSSKENPFGDTLRGCGIRGIAIRKQSYIEDYFDNDEDVGLEQKKKKMKKQGDCSGLFEELWRPESPLCGAGDALFGLDNGDYCFMGGSLVDERDSSAFRIWGGGEGEKDGEKQKEVLNLNGKEEMSDWIWGAPLNQPLFPESLELEVSVPFI